MHLLYKLHIDRVVDVMFNFFECEPGLGCKRFYHQPAPLQVEQPEGPDCEVRRGTSAGKQSDY